MPVRTIKMKYGAYVQYNPPLTMYEFFCPKCLDRQLFDDRNYALNYEAGHIKLRHGGMMRLGY